MNPSRIPPEQYPWWVRFTFYAGGRTRSGQVVYLVLSLVLAAVCAALFVVLDLRPTTAWLLGFGVVSGIISAVWYWASIRWIDRNGSWADVKR